MNSEWKEIFVSFGNMKTNFLKSSSLSSDKDSEFIDQFLLQFTVLWVLQKKLFFNNDEDYFLNMFHLIERNSSDFPFSTFDSFLNSFLTCLEELDDYQTSHHPYFGILYGCKSALFVNLEEVKHKLEFPDDFYLPQKNGLKSNTKNNSPIGILELLDQLEIRNIGTFLGSLYEWLMSSDKKRRGGVYYSPVELTSYITRFSLRTYLMDQMEIDKDSRTSDWMKPIELLDKSECVKFYDKLKCITILDPAVGTGQFLESAADDLLSLYQMLIQKFKDFQETILLNVGQSKEEPNYIDLTKVSEKLTVQFLILNHLIFPNALFGIDIDPFVIPFTRARLFIYTAKYFEENAVKSSIIRPFRSNLVIGDSLLLNWRTAFSPISSSHDLFSLILTNPPYIGESDNKEIFRKYSLIFPEYYEGKIDIWNLFFHLAINQVAPRGIVSFLTTNYWLTASGASKLRNRILHETYILEFIDFGKNRIFQGARGIHSSILSVMNLKAQNPNIDCNYYTAKIPNGVNPMDERLEQLIFQIDQKDLTLNNWDQYFHFIPPNVSVILKATAKNSSPIRESSYSVKEGLITGLNKITPRQITKYGYPSSWRNNGVFILNINNPVDQNRIESFNNHEIQFLRPLYKSSTIFSYSTRIKTDLRLLYLVRNEIDFSFLPNIQEHLEQYSIALDNSLDNPPFLNRPRKKSMFHAPKLVTPQRARTTQFAYNNTEWYAAQDVYFICEEENSTSKLKILLLLLQSKAAFFWFSWMGKKKGSQLEFFGESISNFPIPQILSNPVVMERLTNYLIFLNTLEPLPKELQNIRDFIEHRIANVMVYKCFFHELIFTTPSQAQLFEEVCEFLLKVLEVIDIENYLTARYEEYVIDEIRGNTESEFFSHTETILSKVKRSFERIRKEEKVLELYNQAINNILIQQIEEFYFSKNKKNLFS